MPADFRRWNLSKSIRILVENQEILKICLSQSVAMK